MRKDRLVIPKDDRGGTTVELRFLRSQIVIEIFLDHGIIEFVFYFEGTVN